MSRAALIGAASVVGCALAIAGHAPAALLIGVGVPWVLFLDLRAARRRQAAETRRN